MTRRFAASRASIEHNRKTARKDSSARWLRARFPIPPIRLARLERIVGLRSLSLQWPGYCESETNAPGGSHLLGTIVNAAAIIAGGVLGSLLRSGLPANIKAIVMQGVSLTVILIGLSMAIKTDNVLVVVLSIVIGGILGELLKIEDLLDRLGQRLEQRFGGGDGAFTKGFVTASLVYCVGAMAIMGPLDSGLTGRHTILFVKSILDGVTAVVFASSMGVGVAFSALPVFLYQGAITLAATAVKPLLTDGIIREMTATGGLLIFAIGLNMLTERLQIKVGNLLPAIFVAIGFTILFGRLPL